jgi:hypothetical protein
VTAAEDRWQSLLDDLADHLADQLKALREGRLTDIGAFPVPKDLGRVPDRHAERLADLRAQADLLTAEASVRRNELARRLASMPRRPRNQRRSACYFDSNA